MAARLPLPLSSRLPRISSHLSSRFSWRSCSSSLRAANRGPRLIPFHVVTSLPVRVFLVGFRFWLIVIADSGDVCDRDGADDHVAPILSSMLCHWHAGTLITPLCCLGLFGCLPVRRANKRFDRVSSVPSIKSRSDCRMTRGKSRRSARSSIT